MARKAFISYSHIDEKYLDRLHKHLAMMQREEILNAWTDHKIIPGDNLNREIQNNLRESQIFIALVSPDYLASNYCYEKEFQFALTLQGAGKIRIVSIILESCDWLSSPFKDFLVLPKDGKPISTWTNQNNAFLDVVNGLRRVIEAPWPANREQSVVGSIAATRPRVKRDFDAIQKAEFADKAFEALRNYFRDSCDELNGIGENLRARFEEINNISFTCTVVNRNKMSGGEAHITVHNSKGKKHFGDISFVYERYAEANSSNGSINVEVDDYSMFLELNSFGYFNEEEGKKYSPEQVSEIMWRNFVKKAGIDYE